MHNFKRTSRKTIKSFKLLFSLWSKRQHHSLINRKCPSKSFSSSKHCGHCGTLYNCNHFGQCLLGNSCRVAVLFACVVFLITVVSTLFGACLLEFESRDQKDHTSNVLLAHGVTYYLIIIECIGGVKFAFERKKLNTLLTIVALFSPCKWHHDLNSLIYFSQFLLMFKGLKTQRSINKFLLCIFNPTDFSSFFIT